MTDIRLMYPGLHNFMRMLLVSTYIKHKNAIILHIEEGMEKISVGLHCEYQFRIFSFSPSIHSIHSILSAKRTVEDTRVGKEWHKIKLNSLFHINNKTNKEGDRERMKNLAYHSGYILVTSI